jgi:hypothetical protein
MTKKTHSIMHKLPRNEEEDGPRITPMPVVPLVFGLSPSSGVVRLSRLFSSEALPEGVSRSNGGLIPLTQCHPTLS